MQQPWKKLSHEIVFQKYSRKIEKSMFRLPNGEEKDFYIKVEGPAVAILAITKNNQVILVKQFSLGGLFRGFLFSNIAAGNFVKNFIWAGPELPD